MSSSRSDQDSCRRQRCCCYPVHLSSVETAGDPCVLFPFFFSLSCTSLLLFLASRRADGWRKKPTVGIVYKPKASNALARKTCQKMQNDVVIALEAPLAPVLSSSLNRASDDACPDREAWYVCYTSLLPFSLCLVCFRVHQERKFSCEFLRHGQLLSSRKASIGQGWLRNDQSALAGSVARGIVVGPISRPIKT